jgi:hypothetical protein
MKPTTHRRLVVAGTVVALCAAGGFALYQRESERPPPGVALGPPPTLSVLQAGDASPAVVAKLPTEKVPIPEPKPLPATSIDEQWARLVASKDPAERSLAYHYALNCLSQQDSLVAGVQRNLRSESYCRLSQGHYEDRAARRDLVASIVARNEFGAVEIVHDEGPNGRFKAFADEPEAWAKLLKQARESGVANAEPVALGGEAVTLFGKGDELYSKGDKAGAQALYSQAFQYIVASAVNVARTNAQLRGEPLGEIDFSKDPVYTALAQKFDDATRAALTKQGIALAQKWKAS